MSREGGLVTAIVGLLANGTAWIGGDSAWSNEAGDLTVLRDPKVFKLGGVLLGVSGTDTYAEALTWLEWPAAPDDTWIRTALPKAIDVALGEREIEDTDAALVITVRPAAAAIYILAGRSPSRPADAYAAVGCGANLALGALYATPALTARERVGRALRAAAHHHGAVRGPFRVLHAP